MRYHTLAIVLLTTASLVHTARAESPTTQPATQPATQPDTQPAASAKQRIVNAAGVDKLGQIKSLSFTFNVDRDGKTVSSRGWQWEPATQRVTRTVGEQTHSYTRDKMSDADRAVDGQFINDSFWLLPALHVSWASDDVKIQDKGQVDLPIGEGKANLVTVTYPASGGYTPGDAYDLFLSEDDRVVAWHFRRGNADKPSMTNTFADYVRVGPLHIARDHRNADGSFRLHFTDVKVTLND
jgi:hypothetical protein